MSTCAYDYGLLAWVEADADWSINEKNSREPPEYILSSTISQNTNAQLSIQMTTRI